jgi:DNA-binding NtrC family response regulator
VRAIHRTSVRREGPFVELNCGALPAALTETELFGHERGAFTGAERRSDGLVATAARGTLFLDEIGELTPELQVKLLRILDLGNYRRVGSTQTLTSDTRVIAATHVNVRERVLQRRFREDLFHRLSVLEVRVPALSERVEDIPELARHFATIQPVPLSFSDDAISMLQAMPWPGNVRQLRNTIDRLAVFADGVVDASLLTQLMEQLRKPSPVSVLLKRILRSPCDDNKIELAVDRLVAETLRRTNGNQAAAARMLGVHRKVLERRLNRPSRQSAGP